ncbi:GNAT family N-acetyltransferase [Sneathiella marina]|uniref:GNAT family N-acetyltransferase n=1 Tax=Sneathiella marina TaxID=2950108 RepID=A0ABY4W7R2_9PROT|nr:GNAT family N-acetyltransferase [Sneathiella marina]USG61309.1 GNAT family N-acetyltransferase [Sneathiella marina]
MDFDQDTTASSQLSLTILQSVEDLILHQEEWDHFVEAVGSDVYFLVDWLRTWLKFYGKTCEIRFYIAKQNEQIVAVLPFCIERIRIGFASIRIARFVSSYGTIVVFSPPIQAGKEEPVIKLAVSDLLATGNCDAVCLSPLSGLSSLSTIENWSEVFDGRIDLLERKDVGVHTVFDLPDTFDEYLTSLGKSQKKKYLYTNRSLSKKFDVENRLIEDQEAVDYFDVFVDFHTKLWKQVGKLGHFGEWPDGLEFNRELVRTMAPKGHIKFFELSAGERLLSAGYSFELGSSSFRRLTARDPSQELKKFALGRIGYVKNLEFLINEGKNFAETGPGHYDYKLALSGQEFQMKRLIFTNTSLAVVARTKLYLLMSEYLNFFYYRLWFKKLSPKLRLRSRPLWAFWVKAKL